MKTYPPIRGSYGQEFVGIGEAYVFDKIDGSLIRAEWTRKKGWMKFGSKKRLLDTTDLLLGGAVGVFEKTVAEPLAKLAKDSRWQHLIVFMEYHGPSSFAGDHDEKEEKQLTLFDVCPDKRGVVGPRRFLKLTKNVDVPVATLLGTYNWTRGFVQQVRDGELDGVTFEGVVGKVGDGHSLLMAKAKTQAWVDKVYDKFGKQMGDSIVFS